MCGFLFTQKEQVAAENQIILTKHAQPVEELFGLYKVDCSVLDEDINKGIISGATEGFDTNER